MFPETREQHEPSHISTGSDSMSSALYELRWNSRRRCGGLEDVLNVKDPNRRKIRTELHPEHERNEAAWQGLEYN